MTINFIKGKNVNLRLVNESDAEFIINLRIKRGEFLSQTDPDIKKQKDWISQYKIRENNKKEYYLITDPKEIDSWVKEAEEAGEVAVDTETSSLDPHQAKLIGVSLSSKIGKACYIPIGHNSKKCISKDIVLKKLKPLLEDPSVKKNWSKY